MPRSPASRSIRSVAARRARRRNNIPAEPNAAEPIPKRILRSPLVWLTVVMLLVYATMLVLLYQQVVPDQEVPGGTIPGLGTEAVPIAAKYAAITAIPLSLLFLWADRYRPQRFWVWLMTFGWGACVATYVSAQVNTWAASQLSIIGDGDPATGARAAIFVAPWVEEAAKGTVLFWLAILMRYQWVSRVSGIVLAGLSGRGVRLRREHPLLRPRLPVRVADLRRGAAAGGAAEPVHAARRDDLLRPPAVHRHDSASGWPSASAPRARSSGWWRRWPATRPRPSCT